ncbi:MAG TPA: DUF983 domain-containing protein [Acidimicrobiales bacterium]
MSPSTTRMLSRGFTRRCARCGSGHLFHAWFTMVVRCPRCGYLFDREEGFFLGAYLINFIATEGLLGVVLIVLIALEASGGANIGAIIAAAVAETVLVPLVFYPFSKTVWTAIDMAMHRDQVFADFPGPPAGIT